jgi:hypothetical protein
LASLATPDSPERLSIRTGIFLDDLRDMIGWLAGRELVWTDDGVVVRAQDVGAQLDVVAEQAGTVGALAADTTRHARERAAFRARRDVNVPEAAP